MRYHESVGSQYIEAMPRPEVVNIKSNLSGEQSARFRETLPSPHVCYFAMKRAIDIVGSIALLLIFFPIFLVIPFIIRKDSGEILFKQTRLGIKGVKFEIYKFRTMAVDAEEQLEKLLSEDPVALGEWNKLHKLTNDPRITSVGRFLRATSLDELPQIFNVLKGEMSLVGPRPIVPMERCKYARFFNYYSAAKPGLTGLWQVTGRNDISYSRRIALDRRYIVKRSIALDVSILLKTPWAMFAGRTGY